MTPDKEHILFAFWLKKKSAKAAEMICCALGEGAVTHARSDLLSCWQIGVRDFVKETLNLKSENVPVNLKNFKTESCGKSQ